MFWAQPRPHKYRCFCAWGAKNLENCRAWSLWWLRAKYFLSLSLLDTRKKNAKTLQIASNSIVFAYEVQKASKSATNITALQKSTASQFCRHRHCLGTTYPLATKRRLATLRPPVSVSQNAPWPQGFPGCGTSDHRRSPRCWCWSMDFDVCGALWLWEPLTLWWSRWATHPWIMNGNVMKCRWGHAFCGAIQSHFDVIMLLSRRTWWHLKSTCT